MPESREMTEQIHWQAAKQPSHMACFSEDLKCWGGWDTTCRNKAKDITSSIAWRREAWKEEAVGDLPWKDERGPSSVRRTLEQFQPQRWGNAWDTGWSAYGLFRAHRYHLELKWWVLDSQWNGEQINGNKISQLVNYVKQSSNQWKKKKDEKKE